MSRPVQPVTLLRPHAARRAARFFVDKFPGRSLYAVKANPSPDLLRILWDEGVTHYDVASIGEVRLLHETLPEAVLCFMHPVKAEEAIAEAYFEHGVRTFSLDTLEELEKVVRATSTDGVAATDLNLLVRLQVNIEHAKLSLGAKFGAQAGDVKALLFAARQASDALGICFHVGSQAMSPAAYAEAMGRVRDAIVEAAVTVDIVDVGGGFPSTYPGMEPPPLEAYFDVIHSAFEALPISYSAELWCEPGRALCAEYASLLVRVEKRRGERALHQRRRLWRLVRCGAYRLALSGAAGPRRRARRFARWTSASTDRPATTSTTWPGHSSFRAMSPPATISRSACWALTAAPCAPHSTASGPSGPKSSRTSRWPASTPSVEHERSNVVKL